MRGFRGLLFFCDFYFTFFLILHTNQKLEQQRRKGIEKQKKNILPHFIFFPIIHNFLSVSQDPNFAPQAEELLCCICLAPRAAPELRVNLPSTKSLARNFPIWHMDPRSNFLLVTSTAILENATMPQSFAQIL